MTQAICIFCGYRKFGAFSVCDNCATEPNDEEQLAESMLLTDHFYSLEELDEIGGHISAGGKCQYAPNLVEGLVKAIREIGVENLGSKQKQKLWEKVDFLFDSRSEASIVAKIIANKSGRTVHIFQAKNGNAVIALSVDRDHAKKNKYGESGVMHSSVPIIKLLDDNSLNYIRKNHGELADAIVKHSRFHSEERTQWFDQWLHGLPVPELFEKAFTEQMELENKIAEDDWAKEVGADEGFAQWAFEEGWTWEDHEALWDFENSKDD